MIASLAFNDHSINEYVEGTRINTPHKAQGSVQNFKVYYEILKLKWS